MEFYKNRIICKSDEKNFQKEKSWVKLNTVREVELWEYNSIQSIARELEWVFDKFIIIKNSETWECFERKISDITLFKEWTETKSRKWERKWEIETREEKRFIFIISFEKEKKYWAYVDVDEEMLSEEPPLLREIKRESRR